MKSTIKIFAVFAMVVGFAVGAKAQNTGDGTITSLAQIMQSISVTGQVDLNFGYVAQAANKSIALDGTVTGLPKQGTQNAGRFLVNAASGTSVKLEFSTVTPLTNSGDNSVLSMTNPLYGIATDQSYTSPLGSLTWSSGSTSFNVPANLIGTKNGVYVFIGATVEPTANQTTGAYQGTIKLTATYN